MPACWILRSVSSERTILTDKTALRGRSFLQVRFHRFSLHRLFIVAFTPATHVNFAYRSTRYPLRGRLLDHL